MSNSITGGGKPCSISSEIWNEIYKNKKPCEIKPSNETITEYIDAMVYDEEHQVILADENAPMRYKKEYLFKKNNIPKQRSSTFSLPTIKIEKISVNIKGRHKTTFFSVISSLSFLS